MDYLELYGLSEEPFGPALSERFYFESPQHAAARIRLTHAVCTMKGLAVLVGDLGTGKSMLARRLLSDLPEHEYRAALVVFVHAHLSPSVFLSRLARCLGVPEADSAAPPEDLLDQLLMHLMVEREAGRRAVVLLDEAGVLADRELRRQFRGLLSLEHDGERLITFVVVGTPELDDYLRADPALLQRVACRTTLFALESQGTREYIEHRLRIAGCNVTPFPAETCECIHGLVHGIPRLINNLCDNLLLEGCLSGRAVVSPQMAEEAAAALGIPALFPA
ncbi:AAA family ATPase [bacterium]|nr:AAA family ATPase [bacterium]